MKHIKRYFTLTLTLYVTILVGILPLITSHATDNISNNIIGLTNEINNPSSYSPNEGSYDAELNWVKTTLELESDGTGKVTLLINCTPEANHYGMYIRPLVSNEEISVISGETFAISHEQILEVNYTVDLSSSVAHRIYIQNTSLIYINETLLYQFTYQANFFMSDQITLYQNDPELIVIDLERPIWNGDLEFQELDIILPIDVGESVVSSEFLDEIKFSLDQFTSSYYILTNSTKASGTGNYWLVFTFRKNNLAEDGPFNVRFYLNKSSFSLPKTFNWVVILLVSFFVLLALSLFIIVINVKNKSEDEVTEFKKDLFNLLKQDDEKDQSANKRK
ncbi:MAG TPA: hypothetical protein VMZ29_13745 [Candidatus Bathyarchaeia archaeon]|nr:hypothetical protein [Candidatus Bathyarchaeia archaeon]